MEKQKIFIQEYLYLKIFIDENFMISSKQIRENQPKMSFLENMYDKNQKITKKLKTNKDVDYVVISMKKIENYFTKDFFNTNLGKKLDKILSINTSAYCNIVFLDDREKKINGFYSRLAHYKVNDDNSVEYFSPKKQINIKEFFDIVKFHEIGHCYYSQYVELGFKNRILEELFCDVYAILCAKKNNFSTETILYFCYSRMLTDFLQVRSNYKSAPYLMEILNSDMNFSEKSILHIVNKIKTQKQQILEKNKKNKVKKIISRKDKINLPIHEIIKKIENNNSKETLFEKKYKEFLIESLKSVNVSDIEYSNYANYNSNFSSFFKDLINIMQKTEKKFLLKNPPKSTIELMNNIVSEYGVADKIELKNNKNMSIF